MSAYKFSGHQTFVFRHGWLEKGVNLIRENSRGFLADDAIVKLGVGKNMVESIKYWCVQTGLITGGEETGAMALTDFAKYIFGAEKNPGVDPYLEDDATLWLLHHNVVTQAPESTWSQVVNYWNKPEFTKAELVQFIRRRLDGIVSVSEKTLERDVDCFVRSYAGTRGKSSEENFDCPLLALSLIQSAGDAGFYRLNVCQKRNLPLPIIGYGIMKRLEKMGSTTASVQNMLFEPYSPGQVFKLDENSLIDAVLKLEQTTHGVIAYTDTAGVSNITFNPHRNDGNVKGYAWKLLERYYGRAH